MVIQSVDNVNPKIPKSMIRNLFLKKIVSNSPEVLLIQGLQRLFLAFYDKIFQTHNKMLLMFTLLIVGVVNELLTINRIKRNLSIFKGSLVLVRDILHT